ncbi:MAG: FG-GAP repeat protein [Gemmatimonadetes bacterium]|nr:FG-GAP repeat protein [Gemmatimonadota bacterium]
MTHFRSVPILALLLGAPAALPAQGPGGPPPEVRAAQAQLQAGHADSAVATLEAFLARTPQAVTGRLLLGHAYKSLGKLPQALAAYMAITRPRPLVAQARVAAAGVHALMGQKDDAFRLLMTVKGDGTYDMDAVDTLRDLASLKADPRFAGLHYQPADFTNPFVEPVRILHEWRGEAKNDQYSWIARGIGDVDGDKVTDIVTSAPTHGNTATNPGNGRVYVYSGKSGTLLWTWDGAEQEQAGTNLEGAGDVNADGIPDVIAAAPGSGTAYVLDGRRGRVLLTLKGQDGEGFGGGASGAGDQDGDGHADLLVGAPQASGTGQGAGKAYLFSGADGHVLHIMDGEKAGDGFGSVVMGQPLGKGTPFLVSAATGGPEQHGRVYVYAGPRQLPSYVIDADSGGAAMGAMFTSFVGDVDGDRVADVFASDFAHGARGPSTGRIVVRSGATGRTLLTLTGEHAGDGFGIGQAEAGDVNADGHADLVIGAWQYSAVAPSGGRIYVYSGKDGALLRTITGRIPGETLGFDATGIGDVDGDGVPDMLVTSSWSNIHGFRSGRMYVIAGERSR